MRFGVHFPHAADQLLCNVTFFRFKAKGGGGDVKGASKVEPYAYWPLDRKMLNRRAAKTAAAKSGLGDVIGKGAAKGAKAGRGTKKRRRRE